MNEISFSISEGNNMENNYYIRMNHVDMFYPSKVYNARSIKEDLFSVLKRKEKEVLLKDVHALNDFTLTVNEGDRLGVIGHNGAGKSTLLKTIAGIYPIENGSIEVKGKIRSLFEVSLGFDLESTGRENILYRGLLLGASPAEMEEKMPEIIDFAELGEFINYPLKTYSTGMAVRLAFSVSTCVDGEVLLLDEVLGAGDARFYKKATSRVFELMDKAKLMVYVTHDMNSLVNTCNRAILMEHGRIVFDGDPKDAVKEYEKRYVNA